MEEKEKIIPEDALNLELKYLDENIKPFLKQMDIAYANYLVGAPPLPIIAYGLAAVNAIKRTGRFDKFEIETFRKKFNQARMCLDDKGRVQNGKEFPELITSAMDELDYKIAAARLYARPSDEGRKSIFATLLESVKDGSKDTNPAADDSPSD